MSAKAAAYKHPKPLPVVLHVWHLGKGRVRCLTPQGKWVHVSNIREARDYAREHDYPGIHVRPY